jgi:hypothetical protein
MRSEQKQLVSSPAVKAVDTRSFYGAAVSQLLLNGAAVVAGALLLWWILAHMDGFDYLTTNHLSDAEYSAITSDTLQVNTINAEDAPGNVIVFDAPVVFEGSATGANGPAVIRAVVTTETTQVIDELLVTTTDNATSTTTVQSIVERIEEVRGQCGVSLDVQELFDTLTEFLEYIILEVEADTACLESAEELLVALQLNNTATNNDHTARLDALESGNCTVTTVVDDAVVELNNLDLDLTALNMTIVSTDVTLEQILAILDAIELDFPLLANLSCNINQTVVNNTLLTLQDLRTNLTASQGLLNATDVVAGTCTATLVDIVTALNTYESTLDAGNATYTNFLELFTEHSGNLTALEIRHATLAMTVSDSNVTFMLYTAEYNMCVTSLAALQSDVDDLWTLYNSLVSQQGTHQSVYDSLVNQFNATYTQFNTSAPDCDAELQLYNDLVTSFTTLSLQYQTDYLNIINVIADANAQLTNVTALEAAIAALESTVTSTNATLGGVESALVSISGALQVVDANLTTAGTAVNNTQVLLTQADGLATALASTTTAINATLVTLQTLIANQTARLADHELRIATLEAVTCPSVLVSNHVAGEFTAGEDLTAGNVAALSRNGEAVSATGLYIKDAYQLSPEALGEDEIFSIKTVPIDSSDHFYSVYQLNANSVSTFTVNGEAYNREYTVVVKYSPAHEVVWVATTRYPSVGRSANFSPILSGLEVQSLTLD